MRKIILLGMILLAVSGCFSETKSNNDKGIPSNTTVTEWPSPTKKVLKETVSKYDITQKLGEEQRTLTGRNIIKYDNNGNEIENTCYDSTGKIKEMNIYKYNTQNKQTDWEIYKENGILDYKIKYLYDEKNNKIEENMYDSAGILKWQEKWIYNEINKLLEYKLVIAENSMPYKREYLYDEKGNNYESITYNSSGSIEAINKMKYDSANRVVEDIEYKLDGSIIGKDIYTYEGSEKKEVVYYNATNDIIEKLVYINQKYYEEFSVYNANGSLYSRDSVKYYPESKIIERINNYSNLNITKKISKLNEYNILYITDVFEGKNEFGELIYNLIGKEEGEFIYNSNSNNIKRGPVFSSTKDIKLLFENRVKELKKERMSKK